MFLYVVCGGLMLASISAKANQQDQDVSKDCLALTLPSEFYAVPGIETSVYFDNLVRAENSGHLDFDVTCSLGEVTTNRWSVTPSKKDVGTHSLTVTVRSKSGEKLATAESRLQVVPREAGSDNSIRLLIVGDSLTHASAYPNEIARLLSLPENPKWTMLGTHKPKQVAEGVAHEGYGGWTWQRFATHYEPNPDGTYRKRSSPFVLVGEDKNPKLDVESYFRTHCGGEPPDVIILMLGINDCFSAPPDDPAGIDQRIDQVFGHAKTLIAAFRDAAPEVEIGICLTTPPNSRQEAFEANYQERYTRWGWKRIQHRLVQRQIEQFGGSEDDNLYLIPTELNLDPVAGYPENNAVHPNTKGYQQIARTIYAWLKWRLQDRK